MFTMQNNDSRLRRAARRTLRAEATLIIVILLITIWSVYGLYKLSIGASDTFLGLSFRTNNDQSTETKTATSSNNLLVDISSNDSTQKINNSQGIRAQQPVVISSNPASEPSNDNKLTYSQPNEANQLHSILQQLYSVSQRDKQGNISRRDQNAIRNQIGSLDHLRAQVQDRKLNPISLSGLDFTDNDHYKDLSRGYNLPSNLEDLLEQDKRQRRTDLSSLSLIDDLNRGGSKAKLPIGFPSLMQLGAEAAKANRNWSKPKQTAERVESKFPHVMPDYNDGEGSSSRSPNSDDGLSEYDRVPAESNRDSSQSAITSEDGDNQSGSYGSDDRDNQQDAAETTTIQPVYEEIEPDKSNSSENNNQDDSQSPETGSRQQDNININSGIENDNEESSKGNPEDEAGQQPDEESSRETSKSIDEEVDKMTQPTSGMVSQQDRPFDYKNTVQFDDSPPTMAVTKSVQAKQQPDRKSTLKALEPGDLIAKFQDPNTVKNIGQFREEVLKQRDLHDLEVDHSTESAGINTLTGPKRKEDKKLKRTKDEHFKKIMEDVDRNSRPTNERINRQKRSAMIIENIKAPYEVGKFIDSLNFDSLTGKPSFTDIVNDIEVKSLDLNLADSRNHSKTVDRYTAYNPEPSDVETKNTNSSRRQETMNKNNATDTNKFGTIERRNLFDDELVGPEGNKARKLAADHYYDPDPDIVNSPDQHYRHNISTNDSLRGPDKSRYHYLTSNDTGIQELLDRKNLFNSPSSDDLPPPAEKPDIPKSSPMNRNQSNKSPDHQAEDSLFSVDHGLLLYPSADEEYHHKEKAISKKHKKSDKKKEKKKMTVAIKKGGHKKKKHRKEMKKFLKEKKFKGAKKGKKVAKGKGGQGGKKGKKLYKDKGFKKKGFKNVYHKEEFGQKKSYFDEYRDKDFKKKWKKFDDKYNYAQMKKWQAKDVKAAKKKKDHGEKYKKYDKGKWKKKYEKHSKEHSEKHMKKKKKSHKFK